jgi:hypothetical protein
MLKTFLYVMYFGFLAGIGIILGCYIHGVRVNQPTLMSGVAFVRELPQGERIVGLIETTVFSYEEKRSLEKFKKEHEGNIKLDPEVLKEQQKLYQGGSRGK